MDRRFTLTRHAPLVLHLVQGGFEDDTWNDVIWVFEDAAEMKAIGGRCNRVGNATSLLWEIKFNWPPTEGQLELLDRSIRAGLHCCAPDGHIKYRRLASGAEEDEPMRRIK